MSEYFKIVTTGLTKYLIVVDKHKWRHTPVHSRRDQNFTYQMSFLWAILGDAGVTVPQNIGQPPNF